jgi:hypothetical protein
MKAKLSSADIGVIFVAKISDFELTCEKQQIPNAFYIPKLPDVSSFWRLENQKSLFMRDYVGFVTKFPDAAITDTLLFEQKQGITITH